MNQLLKYTLISLSFISFISNSQVTDNFGSTGAPVSWVVPPCITSVNVVLAGAQGGSLAATAGGSGSQITMTLVVVPGDIITLNVGGVGGCPTAGYNGGGIGYNATNGNVQHGSCGGGGATEVSINGSTIAIAGAGGGAGGGSVTSNVGGNAGCSNGSSGGNTYGNGGGGASTTGGGIAGAPWAGTPPGGSPGSAGQGGNGGLWVTASGGGGGGGYFGGGGGGNDGCCTGANGGGGGGGGSSLSPAGSGCVPGTNTGDGYASITYTPALPAVGGTSSISEPIICIGDPLTLTLAGETAASIQWESAPLGSAIWTPILGGTTNVFLINSVNTETCYRAHVFGDCDTTYSTIICVDIDPLPTVSDAGIDQAVCGTTGVLAANIPVIGTAIWTVTAGGGTETTSNLNNSNVTGLTPGSNIFTWTISNGVCPSSIDDIEIWSETPVTAGVDDERVLCNSAGTSLNLNFLLFLADAGGTWSETSGIPSGNFNAATGILTSTGVTAGVYTFDYTVAAIAPCLDDIATMTITIDQEVIAGLDNAQILCNNEGTTLDLNTLLIGADASGTWTETSAVSSGSFNAGTGLLNAAGANGGVYTFDYLMTTTAPCLNDVATIDITINEIPILTVISDIDICDGEVLNIPAFISDINGTSFSWTSTGNDIGFGLSGNGNIPSINAINQSNSTVTNTVTVTPTSPDMCIGLTETFNINVLASPTILFSGDELSGCEPHSVEFTNNSILGNNCVWDLGDGNTISSCETINYIYTNHGNYDVELTVTTLEGCVSSEIYNNYITVHQVPEISFSYSPSLITITSPIVNFTNSSLHSDIYNWDFGDNTSSTEENPTHTYNNIPGQHPVTLYVENNDGCIDSLTKYINIEDVIIFYVPNTFTPDGDDYNQTFKPIITSGIDIYNYHLIILDRWGEVIFESYNPEIGWAGTYANESLVQDGVYIWQLQFGDKSNDKKYTHHGHVTLLK